MGDEDEEVEVAAGAATASNRACYAWSDNLTLTRTPKQVFLCVYFISEMVQKRAQALCPFKRGRGV